MFLPLYFIAKARQGGYDLNDKGEMFEKNPNGKLIERRFSYEAVSQFWNCHSKIGDPVEETPTVLKFCDWWGPLVYNYDNANVLLPGGVPIQHPDSLKLNPVEWISGMAEDMRLQRKIRLQECEIVDAKYKGKMIPHVKPGLLYIAIEIASRFAPEDFSVVCKYYQEFGEERVRRKGKCQPGCLINAKGGGRQWGHKCQEAYNKRLAREFTLNEGRAGVRESATQKGTNTQ